jgi:hypothetical protein
MFFNCIFIFCMQLQLWTRLRLRLRPRRSLRPTLGPRCRLRLRLRLRLLVWSLRRTWRLCCWTGISTAGTARSCPPSSERMLDTCDPALRARCCRSTTAGFPSTWNWCSVIVCTFIYPFVVTYKLRYLFQATRCRTPVSHLIFRRKPNACAPRSSLDVMSEIS